MKVRLSCLKDYMDITVPIPSCSSGASARWPPPPPPALSHKVV